MLANQNTVLIGETVVLIPYRPEHVAKYHEWMSSPELQELTASEPLTLEQEFEMQQKWREDEDKMTFIIHARTSAFDLTPQALQALPMIGDVNLFFKGAPADEDFEVEVEIMIAEPTYRRNGRAHESLSLLLSYVTSQPAAVPASRLVARIGDANVPSINLFRKLGFEETKRVPVFSEIELRFRSSRDQRELWKAGRREVVAFD